MLEGALCPERLFVAVRQKSTDTNATIFLLSIAPTWRRARDDGVSGSYRRPAGTSLTIGVGAPSKPRASPSTAT